MAAEKTARSVLRAAFFIPSAITVAILAVLAALFVPAPWEPEYYYKFERNMTRLPQQEDIVESDYTRATVHFQSQGDMLEGWLYEPAPKHSGSPPPIVLMCHGLGAQKDMGLHGYAEQFAQAGMAVLVFDYRGFGGSDGAVRHWISWKRHVEDLQSALDWVMDDGLGPGRVDTSRLGLWGVSYSGAHSLTIAAKEKNRDKIKVIVANEPYLTGEGNIVKALKEKGLGTVLRILLAALLDKGRELLGQPPLYIKLVGRYDELVILSMPPEELAISASHQKNPPPRMGGWRNLATARMLIDHLSYKPLNSVPHIKVPVLIVVGTKDEIARPEHMQQAARILGDKAQMLERPYGHIEMHRKMVEPEELAPVVDFLRHHLGLKPDHKGTHPHEQHPEGDTPEVL